MSKLYSILCIRGRNPVQLQHHIAVLSFKVGALAASTAVYGRLSKFCKAKAHTHSHAGVVQPAVQLIPAQPQPVITPPASPIPIPPAVTPSPITQPLASASPVPLPPVTPAPFLNSPPSPVLSPPPPSPVYSPPPPSPAQSPPIPPPQSSPPPSPVASSSPTSATGPQSETRKDTLTYLQSPSLLQSLANSSPGLLSPATLAPVLSPHPVLFCVLRVQALYSHLCHPCLAFHQAIFRYAFHPKVQSDEISVDHSSFS